jgi:hypothetical protein
MKARRDEMEALMDASLEEMKASLENTESTIWKK